MADQETVLELIDAPGRVALIRKTWEPSALTAPDRAANAAPAIGRVVGERLQPTDMKAYGLPMRVIVGRDFLVEVAKVVERIPLWHRNLRADELVFAHRGQAACDAELGTVATGPGEAHLRPLGCTHRVAPDPSGQGTFNIIFESRAPFQFAPAAAARWVPARPEILRDLPDTAYIERLDGDEHDFKVRRTDWPSEVVAVEEPPPLAPPMQVGKVDVAALAREAPAEWDGAVIVTSTAAGLRLSATVGARSRDYWHRNLRCDELLLLHEGALTVRTELGTVALEPGDLAIVPRGVSHHLVATAEALWLTLEAPEPLHWTTDAQAAWEPAASSVPAGARP